MISPIDVLVQVAENKGAEDPSPEIAEQIRPVGRAIADLAFVDRMREHTEYVPKVVPGKPIIASDEFHAIAAEKINAVEPNDYYRRLKCLGVAERAAQERFDELRAVLFPDTLDEAYAAIRAGTHPLCLITKQSSEALVSMCEDLATRHPWLRETPDALGWIVGILVDIDRLPHTRGFLELAADVDRALNGPRESESNS